MAKKGKKPISKPKKKGGSKKKSGSFITKLIVIIFVAILAFFMVFSVFKPSGNKMNPDKQNVERKVKTEDKKSEKKADKKDDKKADKKSDKKDVDKNKKKSDKKSDKKDDKNAEETKVVEKGITGTWMSTTGGAVLTMKNNEYRIDFMGVDSDAAIIGTYTVDGDMITFVNKKDPCKDAKGLYEVRFHKQEIGFKCKSDDCTKRKATLPTEWEWLDTK